MGIVVDAINGRDIAPIVKDHLSSAIDLSDLGVRAFFEGLRNALGDKKISVLRIWGHGTTHYQNGTPYDKGNIRFADDQVDIDTVEAFKPSLEILKPMLDQGSRVELRGCQAALKSGRRMMLRLAEIWDAEVQGSDRSQPMMTWVPPVYSARKGARDLAGAVMVEYNDPRFKR